LRSAHNPGAGNGAERDSGLARAQAGAQSGGGRDDARAVSLAFRGARSALHALYGAKIEATRRSLPGREIAAAVRALVDGAEGPSVRKCTLRNPFRRCFLQL
jgi:hypothetical protein